MLSFITRSRPWLCAVLALALLVPAAGAAPARAEEADEASGALPLLSSPQFWKASAGAAAGAWVGSKLLGLAPVLKGLSGLARITPFGALVARPMLPGLIGAIGAQMASRGLAHADWGMVAAQTVGGALGTAAALLIVPGAGWIAPTIGEAIGWYTGTFVLKFLRKRNAVNGGPQDAVFGVPAIAGLSRSETRDAAALAYEKWLAAARTGRTPVAREAYSGYLSGLAR